MENHNEAKRPVVSVIIPTHNNEDVIGYCLDSLVNQTYPKSSLEIIAVDDGSTDKTGEICDEYADSHEFVKVIHRPIASGGCTVPRNDGIDVATGDWLLFVDGDDWMGSLAIEKFVDHAIEWDSDLVCGRTSREGLAKSVAIGKYGYSMASSVPHVNVREDEDYFSLTFAHSKMIKRSVLKQYDLRFKEVYPEDAEWSIRTAAHCKISFANDYDYYHLRREQGRTTVSTGSFRSDASKHPDRQLKGTEAFVQALHECYGNDLPLFQKIALFGAARLRAFRRTSDWIDAHPEDFPEGKQPFYRGIANILLPYATDDLACEAPIRTAVIIDLFRNGRFEWWNDELITTLKQLSNKESGCETVSKQAFESAEFKEGLDWVIDPTKQRLLSLQLKAAEARIDAASMDNKAIQLEGTLIWPIEVARNVMMAIKIADADKPLLLSAATSYETAGSKWQGRQHWIATIDLDALADLKPGRKTITAVFQIKGETVAESPLGKASGDFSVLENREARIALMSKKSETRMLIAQSDLDSEMASEQKSFFATALARSQQQANSLRSSLNATKQSFAKLKQENKKLILENEKLTRRIKKMTESKSWKITAPLRRISGKKR